MFSTQQRHAPTPQAILFSSDTSHATPAPLAQRDLLYIFLAFFVSKLLFEKIKDVAMTTNKLIWRNTMSFVLLICLVGTLSNSEENFKRETRVMFYYNKGEIDKALNVGIKTDGASRELTFMRAYILADNGMLGERLFEYPQHYATEGLLPPMQRTSPLLPDSVYSLLGATPATGEKPLDFLSRIAHTDSATVAAKDYYLSSLLLEKRIREFKDEVFTFYDKDAVDSFPKHYREALLLYADVAGSLETIPYKVNDAAMHDRFNAFRAEEAMHADAFVRSNYVRRHYGDTYWWYFRYSNVVPIYK